MPDPGWLRALSHRLETRKREDLARSLRTPNPNLIDLGTNDYLGLRTHPHLVEAVQQAAAQWGVGAGASRLIGGTTEQQRRVEARLASFKSAEAALILPTGYMANLALLSALPQPGDLFLMDRLNHASLIDAGTGGVGGMGISPVQTATPRTSFRRYAHRDFHHARVLAERHLGRNPNSTIWLVSDSVFSMDGNLAPIAALAALRNELCPKVSSQLPLPPGEGRGEGTQIKPRASAPSSSQLPLPTGEGRGEGSESNPRASESLPSSSSSSACLILDEAHATGLLGGTGSGADESANHAADICVSTASKALGSLGGVITGPQLVIDAVTNFARQFIFTTAVPPTQVAAIDAALDVIRDEPHRRKRVAELAQRLRAALIEKNWPRETLGDDPIPIIPLVVGEPHEALQLAQRLESATFYAPAIRPPSVPQGTSRVRISLHADLTDAQLARLIDAIPVQ